MKKISHFYSFEYIEKGNFIFYIIINILVIIIIASAMPLITKLMIDFVISGNFKKFFDMILLEVIILLLFLSTQTIKDYIHGKLYADNFIRVSKKMLYNAEYFSRKNNNPNFELMLKAEF